MPVEQQSEEIHEQRPPKIALIWVQSSVLALVKRIGHAFLAHADFFVMLMLMGLVAHYYLTQRIPLFIRTIDFYDASWGLDMIAKARQGIWLGKGAIFTYGPLFQWLLSWAPLRHGMSLGSYYMYVWIFQYWGILLTVYGTGTFLLYRQASWVRVFYLLLLVIFWVPIYWVLFDIKLLLPLCWFAIFLRILPNSFYGFSNLVWRSGIAASLVAIAFLISSDAGVYSVAAFIIVFGASLFYEHHPATLVGMAKYAALTGAFFAVWVLVINLALGKLLDFHYWRDTYEIMTQYRWAQAVHMTPEMTPVFWLAVSLNLLVFVWQWVIPKKIGARERATRLAMLCFGLVTLQSLLVYSEKSHVAMGLFPWIALSVALLLGATQDSLPVSRLIASLAVILVTTGILSGPNHLFIPRNLLQDRSALTGRHTCPQGMYEIDEVCLQAVDFSELQTARDFLTQHTTASDAIGVFPYQNIYGFIARRRVVGEVLQNYLVAGDYLTLRQIKSIEDARPAWAVYAAEPWQGHTVEDISNFTRTPLLWLYWQRWYKNSFMALPGLFILRRDAERGGHWNMVSSSVLLRPPEIPRDGESALSLAPLGEDWDFIKIRLEAKYPWWWKLLKPSSFVVRIRFENGEENLVPALVQPNHPYEIWVYPWDKAQLINYFSPNGEEWHAGSRPRIQGVFLQCLQRDWISVPPSRITIYGVETIKLSER